MCLVAMGPVGFAQVPAGPPFDPDIHPNPIVTFVRSSDFASTTYDEAADNAGIEIVGLSSGTATRESIEITEGSVDEVKILGRDIETLFFPVVRQRFELNAGGDADALFVQRPETGHCRSFSDIGTQPTCIRVRRRSRKGTLRSGRRSRATRGAGCACAVV